MFVRPVKKKLMIDAKTQHRISAQRRHMTPRNSHHLIEKRRNEHIEALRKVRRLADEEEVDVPQESLDATPLNLRQCGDLYACVATLL